MYYSLSIFFLDRIYQIPLSDWLTSGPYETVRTARVLNPHTRGCILLFEKKINKLFTVLVGPHRKIFALSLKNAILRPRGNSFLYGPPNR